VITGSNALERLSEAAELKSHWEAVLRRRVIATQRAFARATPLLSRFSREIGWRRTTLRQGCASAQRYRASFLCPNPIAMLGLAEIIAPLPRIATQLTQRRNANRTVTRQLTVR
jgi:hypothetical protein